MDVYQSRMKQIQEVSNILTTANSQLDALLKKIGWSKSNINKVDESKVTCNVDKTHKIKTNNKVHEKSCFLKALGWKDPQIKDLPDSSAFAYMKSNVVVPVLLEQENYARHGVEFDVQLKNSYEYVQPQNTMATMENLIEHNNDINEYTPTDPLDELRFIYSWERIPLKYQQLNLEDVQEDIIESWLHENLPTRFNSGFFINTVLQAVRLYRSDPNSLFKNLNQTFGAFAKGLVLSLWIFISAKGLCLRKNIAEHTRNEFDVYGLAKIKSPDDKGKSCSGVQNNFSLADIPCQWLDSRMSREQKLAIYEEVCMIGKSLRGNPSLKFTELQTDAQEQMKVLMSLEEKKGEKTHLEIIAEMRDYKRRRQSYRGKNKSNVKMTPTEVLREIVEQHMLYYNILRNPNTYDEGLQKTNKEDDNRTDLRQSRYDRSNDRSVQNPKRRSRSPKTSREHRSRSRSRDKIRHSRRHTQDMGRSESCERIKESRNESSNYERKRNRSSSRDRSRRRSRSRERMRSRELRRRSRSRGRDYERLRNRSRSKQGRRGRSRTRSQDRNIHRGQENDEVMPQEISNITFY